MKTFLKIAAVSSLILSLSGCELFGGSDNTQKPAALIAFTPERTIVHDWSVSANSGTRRQYVNLVPAYYDGVVYTADVRGHVTATDSHTGRRIWVSATGAPISAGPAVDGHIVVVGTGDAHVVGLDIATGHVMWIAHTSNEVLAVPTISQGRVFIKTLEGKLFCYVAETGDLMWTHDHGAPGLILRASSSPVVAGSTVIAAYADGKIDAMDVSTGQLRWSVSIAAPTGVSPVERLVDIDATPVVSNGVIYAASFQGAIAAVSLRSGSIYWRKTMSTYTGLALTSDQVIVSDENGYVTSFDRASGAVAWRQNNLMARAISGPAVLPRAVVVGDYAGYLHFLSLNDGHFIARTQMGSAPIQAAPKVNGPEVFALNTRGALGKFEVR